MNIGGNFIPTIPPIKNASINDQLTKFKKEANFADLENLTGNGYRIQSLFIQEKLHFKCTVLHPISYPFEAIYLHSMIAISSS